MLFLPHHNEKGVESVVSQLTSDDGAMPPTALEDAREVTTLVADSTAGPLLARVNEIPRSGFITP